MQSFAREGKKVSVVPAQTPDRPFIVLNASEKEGEEILPALAALNCPEMNLVVVGGLDWNHDLAPWDCPAVFKNDDPFTGGADEYLALLTEEILPEAEKCVPGVPAWRGIAGYSLAGLFALYAACRSPLFSRAASVSGSLWFPGILEDVENRSAEDLPEHLYLSLGDREERTRNPLMRKVRENTEEIERHCAAEGVDTVFTLNPGNHFQDPAGRTAAGIFWMLSR